MVDFSLTEDQIMLQDIIKKLVKEDVRPVIQKYDSETDLQKCIPWPLIEKALSLGLGKVMIPREYGGEGLKILDVLLLAEELAWGDPGFATTVLNNIHSIAIIAKYGTDIQKANWLIPYINDTSYRFLISDCFTEPSAGADIFSPDPKSGIRTQAKKDGDYYILNGTKSFITNAGLSKLLFVWAKTDIEKGAMDGGLSLFVVPSDTENLHIGRIENKLGFRLSQQAEIYFDKCKIPKENLVGKEGMGFQIALSMIPCGFLQTAAYGIGIAKAAYEYAYEYAKNRVQGGTEIINHQAISHKLCDMLIRIESTRALAWKAAWSIDAGKTDFNLCRISKIMGGETALYAANEGMQIMGAYGYTKDYPMEKIFRDARVLNIVGAGNEAHRTGIMSMIRMKERQTVK